MGVPPVIPRFKKGFFPYKPSILQKSPMTMESTIYIYICIKSLLTIIRHYQPLLAIINDYSPAFLERFGLRRCECFFRCPRRGAVDAVDVDVELVPIDVITSIGCLEPPTISVWDSARWCPSDVNVGEHNPHELVRYNPHKPQPKREMGLMFTN